MLLFLRYSLEIYSVAEQRVVTFKGRSAKVSRLRDFLLAFHSSYVRWLGSRVITVLDSGEKAGVQIASATLSGNSLRQTV